MRRLSVLALAASLTACGTLPAREADAFRDLQVADQARFDALTRAERQALVDWSVRDNAGLGYLTVQGRCADVNAGPAAASCTVVRMVGDAPTALDIAAPETRRLVAGLNAYGSTMTDLATAEDIAEAQAAATSAASGVGALATAVGAAPIVPVVQLVARLYNQGLVAERRRALLTYAERADGWVATAADRMSRQSALLKANLLRGAAARLTDARTDQAIWREEERAANAAKDGAVTRGRAAAAAVQALAGRAANDPELTAARAAFVAAEDERRVRREAHLRVQREREAAARELVAAADAYAEVDALKTDFRPLVQGHAALLEALRHPERPMPETLRELGAFADLIDALGEAGETTTNG